MARRTAAEEILFLKNQNKSNTAKIKKLLLDESKKKKALLLRKQTLVGKVILTLVDQGEFSQSQFDAIMDKFLTKKSERQLFDLL